MSRCLATAALLVLPALASAEGGLVSDKYCWQKVSAGIYLHSQCDPLAAPVDGNATVLINDRDVFVVDTHLNPAAARDLVGEIRKLTDKPVSHVVNTHWHDDHTNGNYVIKNAYPGVRFIAHRATLKALRAEWQKMEDQRASAYGSSDLADLLAKADELENSDAYRAAGLRMFAAYKQALEPELPALELVYPDTVFDEQLLFERGDRTILIEWMGRGNTDGDVVVWLPEEQVLITGDLLVAPIPFAFDSPMVEWIATLEAIAVRDPALIIPGHGAAQKTTHYLQMVKSLLRDTVAAVRDAHDEGVEYANLADTVSLAEHERRFVDDDPARAFAWRAFFITPGLKSAWVSLGYSLPASPER